MPLSAKDGLVASACGLAGDDPLHLHHVRGEVLLLEHVHTYISEFQRSKQNSDEIATATGGKSEAFIWLAKRSSTYQHIDRRQTAV